MTSSQINCAVIGLGIGEQHARAILENINCHLNAVSDFDQEKANAFIKKYSLSFTNIQSFDSIIKDNSINFVSLASFDDHHADQVMLCLRHDKHIFVEKPLCQTKEQLRDIYSEWKRRECALASNLVLRTAPLYQYLKEQIIQGRLGKIYSFDGDYLYGRLHKITEGWRKNVKNYSVMQGGGIHLVDLMMWLSDQKPNFVISHKNKIATQQTSFQYHDFQSSLFSFESGLIGRITANFGCVHSHQHVIRIFGTKGTFIYDDMGARIYWNRDEERKPEFLKYAPKPKNKGELIHPLIKDIRHGNIRHQSQREFDLMSVVLAADESLLHTQPLKIEYLT